MGVAAGGAAVVGGIVQAVVSGKKASKIEKAINDYTRQDLDNAYADVQVSQLSADLQREELARSTASTIQALKSGGVRSIIGGAGAVQEQNVLASRAIGADLDAQQKNIDQLRASDEASIRGIREQREIQDLQGLGNELNTQRQNVASGINNAFSGAATAATAGMKGAAGAAGQGSNSNAFLEQNNPYA